MTSSPTRRILVTGGGGFLGLEIVRQLCAVGYEVRTFSRQSYAGLAALNVEQHRGDIADAIAVAAAVAGMDAVIHAAAKPGISGAYTDYYRANVLGCAAVINACRQHGVSKLVYTSSPSVAYAGLDQNGVDESTPYPRRYLAHYAKTKALGEQLVMAANSPQLQTVALRPHLVWGPGDQHLMPRLLERARSGRLRLLGNGMNLVDAVYIDNAAAAHLLALAALVPGSRAAGNAYYISNDEPWPLKDVINGLLATAGLPPVTKRVSPRLGYGLAAVVEGVHTLFQLKGEPPLTRFAARQLATSHWYNITAAKRDINYTPHISMHEGMARLARSQGPTNPD